MVAFRTIRLRYMEPNLCILSFMKYFFNKMHFLKIQSFSVTANNSKISILIVKQVSNTGNNLNVIFYGQIINDSLSFFIPFAGKVKEDLSTNIIALSCVLCVHVGKERWSTVTRHNKYKKCVIHMLFNALDELSSLQEVIKSTR